MIAFVLLLAGLAAWCAVRSPEQAVQPPTGADVPSSSQPLDNEPHGLGPQSPQEASPLMERALERMRAGDLEGAESMLTALISADPNDGVALGARCEVRFWRKQFQAAEHDCTRSLAIHPEVAAVLDMRGMARRHQGRAREALADSDAAVNLEPNNALTHYNRGLVLTDLDRDREAISAFDRAIALRSDDPDFFADRSRSRLRVGDAQGAAQDAAEAVRLSSSPDVPTVRGSLPDSPAVRAAALSRYQMLHGNALQSLERWAEAEAAYTQAIAANQQCGSCYLNRAMVRARSGDRDGFRADLATGCRLDSDACRTLANQLDGASP